MSFNSGAVHYKDISRSSPKGNDRATELYIIPEGLTTNILDSKRNAYFCNISFTTNRTYFFFIKTVLFTESQMKQHLLHKSKINTPCHLIQFENLVIIEEFKQCI